MRMSELHITKAENGYIVRRNDNHQNLRIYTSLDEVMEEVLMFFESRADTSHGSSYGKVTVERGKKVENDFWTKPEDLFKKS